MNIIEFWWRVSNNFRDESAGSFHYPNHKVGPVTTINVNTVFSQAQQ